MAIWAGVHSGVVDVLGSDHAPHTREEKDHAYPGSHSGMTGVQTLLPMMLDHVNAGRLTLERLVDLTSHGPQRIFGIRGKGRIAVGYDADLSIVDLKRQETITNTWIRSKLRLDALRWRQRQRLAGRHGSARASRYVGGRDRGTGRGAAGVVPGAEALLATSLSSRNARLPSARPEGQRVAGTQTERTSDALGPGSRTSSSAGMTDWLRRASGEKPSITRGSSGWCWRASWASRPAWAASPAR